MFTQNQVAPRAWMRHLAHALSLALVLSLTSGCGIFSPDETDDGGGGGDVDTSYALATTENQLIKNFERAHRDRNFQEYENLLAENFQFWFAPEDVDLAPNGFFWDRAADVASTERMFNGAVGERPDGTPQPAVQNITLTLTGAEPAWIDASGETVGGQTPVPEGTMKRRYEVAMRVSYTAGDIVSEVNGEQLFYVIPTQLDQGDGVSVTEWKLLIWRDFGDT